MADQTESEDRQVLSVFLNTHIFGLPTATIRDVLRALPITHVPMAPLHIAGISNLRGRVVTAVDLRKRMNIGALDDAPGMMSVVVESRGELYSLLVDRVGDVLTLDSHDLDPLPLTLRDEWRGLCQGVNKRDEGLMVILDLEQIIQKTNT